MDLRRVSSRLELAISDLAFAQSEFQKSVGEFASASDAFATEARIVFAFMPEDEDGLLLEERLRDASALEYAATELELIATNKTP